MSDPLNNIPSFAPPLSPEVSSQSTESQTVANSFNRTVSSAPPSYAQSMAASACGCPSTDSAAPPPYVPVDCASIFNTLPTNAEEVSYERCLDTLSVAYGFDVAALATKIRTHYIRGLFMPTEVVVPKLLFSSKHPTLDQLAKRLFTVFKNSWRELRCAERNQMALIFCLYFLEQKAQVLASVSEKKTTAPDTGFVPNQAALVRKELFQLFDQLTESDKVGLVLLRKGIEEFLADPDRDELREDLKCEVPISQNLTLPELRYEQIPGTTVRYELRPQIDNYNEIYGINFYDLIETIGDARIFSRFPVHNWTCELLSKNNPKFGRQSLKNELYFMDRNAKFVIAGMDNYHNATFAVPDQPSDEKQSLPVQESSACEQKKAEVMQNFMQYLTDKLKKDGPDNVLKALTTFFIAKKWPASYVPEAYRGGKVPK